MKARGFALTAILLFSLSALSCAPAPPPAKKQVLLCDPGADKYSEANIRDCTKALRKKGLSDYERSILLNIRGNNNDGLKHYDAAIADYSEVIRLRPDFDYAYANRALALCEKGDCKAALADYGKALKLDPKNAFSLYGRGVARLRLGDAAGGNADIAAANAADPDMAGVYREIHWEP